jgi:hypothetical protein
VNEMRKKVHGHKKEEVTGEWIQLGNEDVYNLCFLFIVSCACCYHEYTKVKKSDTFI